MNLKLFFTSIWLISLLIIPSSVAIAENSQIHTVNIDHEVEKNDDSYNYTRSDYYGGFEFVLTDESDVEIDVIDWNILADQNNYYQGMSLNVYEDFTIDQYVNYRTINDQSTYQILQEEFVASKYIHFENRYTFFTELPPHKYFIAFYLNNQTGSLNFTFTTHRIKMIPTLILAILPFGAILLIEIKIRKNKRSKLETS